MASPFDNKKLTLMTKTLPNGSFPPNLKFDMYKDNPQLFVLTGNKKGEGITYVRAGLEHKTAGLLCQAIETIADSIINEYKTGTAAPDSEENTIVSIECKAGKERETVAKVVTGKLKDNTMFLSVISVKEAGAPVVQFIFQPDLFHPVTVTGSDKFNSCLSAMAAKEWAIRARMYWYMYSVANPNDDTAQKPPYQGNNQNNNQGGGGYAAPASGDLPWES